MNTPYYGAAPRSSELYHHGIMGMKWGVRRYQNEDGSYTAAGRARYGVSGSRIGTGRTNLRRAYENERNLPANVRERENYKRTQKEVQNSLKKEKSNDQTRKQRRAQKMYERVHSVRDDDARMDRMSRRQLKSLEKAERYYKEVAAGKKPTQRRGIIKRNSDWYRSMNKTQRVGTTLALNAITTAGQTAVSALRMKSAGMTPQIDIGRSAMSAVTTTAWNVAYSELLYAKGFGHF